MAFLNRFKKHKVRNANWEFYESLDEKEKDLFVSIDLTYLEEESQQGFIGELFIRIRLPENRLNGKLPLLEEQQFQNSREEELCNELIKNKVQCIQVGRLTYGGQKQYVFEYNDLPAFKKVFNTWKESFSEEYAIELNLLKPFEYYSELIPDKYIWQQIGNRHVIEQLLEAGSDESKEHFIEHGIFGNPENLAKLFNEIKEHEIEMIGMDGDLLEIGINSSIELDDITNQTDYLIEVSEKYNCKYDGWNTAIVK